MTRHSPLDPPRAGAEPTPTTSDERPASVALEAARVRWARRFGTGARRELEREWQHLASSARSPSSGAAVDDLAAAAEQVVVCRHGHRALRAELVDERERDLAVTRDPALVSYERKWARKLEKLMRVHAARWYVPGLSAEEVRDALTLRLLEALRGEPPAGELPALRDPRHHRAGKEWGLSVLASHVSVLRQRFRLGAAPVDFGEQPVPERSPTLEERWLEVERGAERELASARAEQALSRVQRRWLGALRGAANAGAFFESSERLNLSAASRALGKDRSSAQRAYRELQHRFQRELERLK